MSPININMRCLLHFVIPLFLSTSAVQAQDTGRQPPTNCPGALYGHVCCAGQLTGPSAVSSGSLDSTAPITTAAANNTRTPPPYLSPIQETVTDPVVSSLLASALSVGDVQASAISALQQALAHATANDATIRTTAVVPTTTQATRIAGRDAIPEAQAVDKIVSQPLMGGVVLAEGVTCLGHVLAVGDTTLASNATVPYNSTTSAPMTSYSTAIVPANTSALTTTTVTPSSSMPASSASPVSSSSSGAAIALAHGPAATGLGLALGALWAIV